jgi:hypothetical protein
MRLEEVRKIFVGSYFGRADSVDEWSVAETEKNIYLV